jgi:hypothetical protein
MAPVGKNQIGIQGFLKGSKTLLDLRERSGEKTISELMLFHGSEPVAGQELSTTTSLVGTLPFTAEYHPVNGSIRSLAEELE